MIRNPDPGGDIKQPAGADRRVDRQPRQRIGRQLPFALQDIVGEDHRAVEVLQKIVQRLPHRRRDDGAVGFRRRHQHLAVDRLVEAEDRPVGVFVGIVEIVHRSGLRAGRMRRDAA